MRSQGFRPDKRAVSGLFLLFLLLSAGVGILPVTAAAEEAPREMTGLEVAEAAEARPLPADFKAEMTMVLTNSKGKTRESTLRSVSADDNSKQIIWFLSPKDDRGVAFLKIEKDSGPDEMRLWLPAFKKIRRISSSKKGDAFMGSDISYEDMTSRDLNEYEYRHLGRETVDGADCHKLETIPLPEAESTYSKFVTWITADEYLPVKEQTFDKAGRHYKDRTLQYEKLGEYMVPDELFVKNVQKNHTTRLTFENMEVDTGVEDGLFAEKNLKRLPR